MELGEREREYGAEREGVNYTTHLCRLHCLIIFYAAKSPGDDCTCTVAAGSLTRLVFVTYSNLYTTHFCTANCYSNTKTYLIRTTDIII